MFCLLLLYLQVATTAHADRYADEIRSLVGKPDQEQRVLELMVRFPSEDVILAALDYRAGTDVYAFRLDEVIQRWVGRSPSVRDRIKAEILAGDVTQKDLEKDLRLLVPMLETDSEIQEFLLKNISVMQDWVQFLDPRDPRSIEAIFFVMEREFRENSRNRRGGAIPYESIPLWFRLPEFKARLLGFMGRPENQGSFEFTQFSYRLVHRLKGDADFLKALEKALTGPVRLEASLEISVQVLMEDPENLVARDALVRGLGTLLTQSFVPEHNEIFERFFRTVFRLRHEDRRLDEVSEDAYPLAVELIQRHRSNDRVKYWIPKIVLFYAEYWSQRRYPDAAQRLEALLDELSGSRLLQEIFEALSKKKNLFTVGIQDFIAKNVKPQPDRSSGGTRSSLSPVTASRRQELLFAESPPSSWRSLVGHLHLSEDEFGLSGDLRRLAPELREQIERGEQFRLRSLDAAAAYWESQGLILKPVTWLNQQFMSRTERARRTREESSTLTPQQQLEAQNRVNQKWSFMEALKNLVPYDQLYKGDLWREELNTQNQATQMEDLPIADWRVAMRREMRSRFISGLEAILRSDIGVLVAYNHSASGAREERSLTLQDLSEVELVAFHDGAGILWKGRKWSLLFDGKSDPSPSNSAHGFEVAALVLGDGRRIAQEIVLNYFFHDWLDSHCSAEAILQGGSEASIKNELRVGLAREELISTGWRFQERLISLLWAPLESDPHHWQKREAQAAEVGDTGWRFASSGDYRRPSPGKESLNILSRPERYRAFNKSSGLKERDLFTIQKISGSDVPLGFYHGYLNTPSQSYGIVSEDHSEAEFVLHTEALYVPKDGVATIPRPHSSERLYDLKSLQVYTHDALALEAGKDYQVLVDASGALYIQFLGVDPMGIRYSAGFVSRVPESLPEVPSIEASKVRDLLPRFKEAGLLRVEGALEELLKMEEYSVSVPVTLIEEIFRYTALYAEPDRDGVRGGSAGGDGDDPILDARRFLDRKGVLRYECDGARDLFGGVLQKLISAGSEIVVWPLPMFQVGFGLRKIRSTDAHASVFLQVPGSEVLLRLDTTPPSQGDPPSGLKSIIDRWKQGPAGTGGKEAKPESKWSRFWKKILGSQKSTAAQQAAQQKTPQWLENAKNRAADQHPREPGDLGDVPVSESEIERRIARIRKSRKALHDFVLAEVKKGHLKKPEMWDPTEPLLLTYRLADLTQEVLAGNLDMNQASERLAQISRWFVGRPHGTEAEILGSIQEFVYLQKDYLQKFEKKGDVARYPHYRDPRLQNAVYEVLDVLGSTRGLARGSVLSRECGLAMTGS